MQISDFMADFKGVKSNFSQKSLKMLPFLSDFLSLNKCEIQRAYC